MKWLYKNVLKPFLFLMNPEFVHHLFVGMGSFFGKTTIGRAVVGVFYRYKGPSVARTVDGIRYEIPVVLAAGFDYNGKLTRILDAVSFGGVEIGSVTARRTEGNPKPRLKRMIRSQSLVVYKGLKNDGVDVIINRLKRTRKPANFVWGISIAKTNDEKTVSPEAGVADYTHSFRRVNEEAVGDFYTINISCPNVHGGESFTTPELLKPLMVSFESVECHKPVYVKMPINLSWEAFNQLLEILDVHNVQGVVIGNLNKQYADADFPEEAPSVYRGGLSGKTCRSLSTELIKKTKAHWGDRFTIVGCGGVMSAEDALEKLDAGADLLQLISGMIFNGPHLMKEIAQALAKRESYAPRAVPSSK